MTEQALYADDIAALEERCGDDYQAYLAELRRAWAERDLLARALGATEARRVLAPTVRCNLCRWSGSEADVIIDAPVTIGWFAEFIDWLTAHHRRRCPRCFGTRLGRA